MARIRSIAWLVAALLSVTAACGLETDDQASPGGKADGPHSASDLTDGTAPAVGLLRFLNDPSTTFAVLDNDVRLRSDTASNLIEHRDGDGVSGPNPFDDVAEVDGVSRVGVNALQKLLDFAFTAGFIPEGDDELGVYDGVSFSVDQAASTVLLVNTASEAELDVDAALDSRAVAAIVEARPISSVLVLSQLPFVGTSALEKLKSHSAGGIVVRETGVLSDLDKTIIPPAPSGQALPDAPYAGIAELISILEFGDGSGAAGDVNFVTARQPEMVVEIPQWLSEHGVPGGEISTGISGIPSIARAEKVRDITDVFEANPTQRFVMFGDSSHVDADVYREIKATFGDRVVVAFIHDVKAIDPSKVEGLVLIDNYAEAAAELLRLERIDEEDARIVMEAVVEGGEITAEDMEALLSANAPN